MRNKGFTLVELLGVIILLAAIVLIAFPPILNQIKKSQNQIDDATNDLIVSSAKLYVDNNKNEFFKVNGNAYCVPVSVLIDSGELNREFIKHSIEKIDDYFVEVKYESPNKNFEYTVSNECKVQYGCALINDMDNNGISVGDEIGCGTEKFYVISTDSSQTEMLTKYRINLNTHIQDISYETTNTVKFSSGDYWSDNFASYETKEYIRDDGWPGSFYPLEHKNRTTYIYNSSQAGEEDTVSYYVDKYRDKLVSFGILDSNGTKDVQIKLMSYEQALSLGCVQYDYEKGISHYTCGPGWIDEGGQTMYPLENYAPEWIWATSYWLGSHTIDQAGNHRIWTIDADGSLDRTNYKTDNYEGVRPVVVIDTSKIMVD